MSHILIARSNYRFKHSLKTDEISVLNKIIDGDFFDYTTGTKLDDTTELHWVNADKYLDQLELIAQAFHSFFRGYALVIFGDKTDDGYVVTEKCKITFDHRSPKVSPCKFIFEQRYPRK